MAVATEVNKASWWDEFRQEFVDSWRQMPDKGLFFGLALAWSALFHFWGNAVFGWVVTPSLFEWMYFVFDTSEDDSHGTLIPFLVLGLFWWKRRQLLEVPKAVWWPALSLVVLGLLLHIAGYMVQQTRVSIIGYFLGLYGLMGLVWGKEFLKASFFPMFLFVFCVPVAVVSDTLTFPLRMVATDITTFICRNILGIDLIRDGALLYDPAGRFRYEVAAACGGLRSLIAMIALTTVFGFVVFRSTWRRLAMMGSAVPLAILGNVVRLVSIIVAAEAFGRSAGDFVHDKLSLLPYIPAFIGILVLNHVMREPEDNNGEAVR